MITHKRAAYTRRSLPRLLDTCRENDRVWVWQNGSDAETLEVVRTFEGHPKLAELHVSPENVGIRIPTNWFWQQSTAPLVGKVDDDCLMSPGWIETLSEAHKANPAFGVIACWHYRREDFDPVLAAPKVREFDGGGRLLVNFWTPGSGYLMKRACFDEAGPLAPDQTFSTYCIELAVSGWTNGWHIPIILQDHMDDPRSEFTLLQTDEDLENYGPLSAQRNRVRTIREWEDQHRRSAMLVQTASVDPRDYRGVRSRVRRAKQRLRRLFTGHWW